MELAPPISALYSYFVTLDCRKGHMDVVYHILRYMKSAPRKGLFFLKKNWHMNFQGYCDPDWASCQDDKRSIYGCCRFVGGNLVSWHSKKQPIIVKSMAEVEYRAMTLEVIVILWLKRLLEYLKVNHGAKIKLWCDSKLAINIVNNLMQHDKTKYVEIDRFFIKEKPKSELLELSHVDTGNQVADCLIKGLNSIDLVRLCNKMCLMDIFCSY
jgi:hypothetical protein